VTFYDITSEECATKSSQVLCYAEKFKENDITGEKIRDSVKNPLKSVRK